jgi:hypothetical protein
MYLSTEIRGNCVQYLLPARPYFAVKCLRKLYILVMYMYMNVNSSKLVLSFYPSYVNLRLCLKKNCENILSFEMFNFSFVQ